MTTLFSGYTFERSGDYFHRGANEILTKALFEDIKNLSEESLRAETPEEIAARMSKPFIATVPKLKFDSITIEDEEFEHSVFKGSPTIKATRIRYYIPFDGDPRILSFKPSTMGDRLDIRGTIIDQNIILQYESIKNDPKEIKTKFSSDQLKLDHYLKILSTDIKMYNEFLIKEVTKTIRDRITLLTEQDWEKELGYPRRNSSESGSC